MSTGEYDSMFLPGTFPADMEEYILDKAGLMPDEMGAVHQEYLLVGEDLEVDHVMHDVANELYALANTTDEDDVASESYTSTSPSDATTQDEEANLYHLATPDNDDDDIPSDVYALPTPDEVKRIVCVHLKRCKVGSKQQKYLSLPGATLEEVVTEVKEHLQLKGDDTSNFALLGTFRHTDTSYKVRGWFC